MSTSVSIVNRNNNNNFSNNKTSSSDINNKTYSISNTTNRKTVTKLKSAGTKNTVTTTVSPSTQNNSNDTNNANESNSPSNRQHNENASVAAVTKSMGKEKLVTGSGTSSTSATTIKHTDDQLLSSGGGLLESKQNHKFSTQSTVSSNNSGGGGSGTIYDDSNVFFCGPTTARNLFWNFTRVGEMNVQPCPGGATGIAKWRCAQSDRSNAMISQYNRNNDVVNHADDDQQQIFDNTNNRLMWQPATPDLTQCRSLWLNNLEVRVNQRDSSLVSIANDLSQVCFICSVASFVFAVIALRKLRKLNLNVVFSPQLIQVTNSKTLYGGDMLVTTKIIQTMSEKMTYDIETFPDQKQREAIVSELLNGIVKTGSNLLDETQHLSWLDLSFEDQMRVATSLLTGLEDNAFLLADTIARERNVVQKVKNICECWIILV